MGEVIEWLVVVVKEFVENVFDVGVIWIEVEFCYGGCLLMWIEDNGYGMLKDDVLMVFEWYVMSKIVEVDDLNWLVSFGFCGEVLLLIVSVLCFEL